MKKESYDKGFIASYHMYVEANPHIKQALYQEKAHKVACELQKKAFEFASPEFAGGAGIGGVAGAALGYGASEYMNRKKIQELESQLAAQQASQITGAGMYSDEDLAQMGYFDPSYGAYYMV